MSEMLKRFCATFLLVYSAFATADILHGYGNNKFAVKTPYFWTHPRKTFIPDELYTLRHNNNVCRAIQLNFVTRHAARYNEPDVMDSFSALQIKINRTYSNSNYSFISTWINDYPKNKANSVTNLGYQEMKYLGAKYGSALRSLLSAHLDTVRIRCSHIKRTATSGLAFMEGMRIGVGSENAVHTSPVVDDRIILFYNGCTNYVIRVLGNKTLMHEKFEFRNSSVFKNMIAQIENRLSMQHSLTADDVKTMYRLCASEVSIMNCSDWCTIQTDSDREIMEYDNDLNDYYSRFYGHPVIAEMTCPLVEDVFKSMDNAIHQYKVHRRYPVADLRFGHSPTIGPFMAALGLFKDPQLPTARNFASMKNRIFSVNTVVPFSANLGFVLYDCGNGLPNNQLLRLYVNEEPVVIPACGSITCQYSDVRRYYSNMVDKCNWDDVCKNVNFIPPNIVG